MNVSTNDFSYIGSELDLFAAVTNWKSYWAKSLQPFIRGEVLEVGAGIGSNTRYLDSGTAKAWVCLEPDPALLKRLAANVGNVKVRRNYEFACGTLQDLPQREFDTLLYIDVLEHIEEDRKELETAATCLRPGGRVIVLSPAHQNLYTPFDAAIGHFRRYNRRMIRSLSPIGLRLEKMWYLDSAGLLLSTANRLFLRQSMPTKEQLKFWDSYVIPVSRLLDPCLLRSAGKSIVAIWQR